MTTAIEHAATAFDREFYETPRMVTRYLFETMWRFGVPIRGRCLEPCVGSGAIVSVAESLEDWQQRIWITNDIDPYWQAVMHVDATLPWDEDGVAVDWVITNPPFDHAIDIIESALRCARVGVAMHVRASFHEILKTGKRRTFLSTHRPHAILWLPRVAFQRSPKTGAWTTDSVACCWLVWLKNVTRQVIDYMPDELMQRLDAETPAYRARMDALMGFDGPEGRRREQRKMIATQEAALALWP